VEATPPVPGKVYDGPPGIDGSCVDVDYIENHSTLRAHWKGFHDPHSTMVEYFVYIGSCKDCEDVLVKQSVGIITGIAFSLSIPTRSCVCIFFFFFLSYSAKNIYYYKAYKNNFLKNVR
jgi:hypothetical protein